MVDEEVLLHACDAARAAGAAYAEARAEDLRLEHLEARDGAVEQIVADTDRGWGLRCAVDGGWGFAGTADTDSAAVARVAAEAVAIARASAAHRAHPLALDALPVDRGSYQTAVVVDPFIVPLDRRVALLIDALHAMQAAHPRVTVTTGSISLQRTDKLFVNTAGAHLRQQILFSGAWMAARARDDTGYTYQRSYGNMRQAGWEFVEALDLPANAPRVGREAGELVAADWVPSGPTTAIVGSEMMALLVHESCGHPIELDRVLGWEAAFAGTSFLLPDMRGHFAYGSPAVNITADALTPGGLGTFGWDDEGTPAARTAIVRDGVFTGYLTSRETAPALGQRSNGTARATSWGRIPIVRMTNVSLEADPHGSSLDALIAAVDHGLYLETPSSWSLDDKRMNFHFSVEMCRAIEHGQLGALYKGASFQDRTPHFWGNVEAVGGRGGESAL